MTRLVLLTGATGYVGGRLLPLLVADGLRVRCLVRRPERIAQRVPEGAEVVAGDVLDETSLVAALSGVDAAYYLVHSMGAVGNFEDADRRAAQNFAGAAMRADVKRIIYLGGLGEERSELSSHLRSRHEVGEILRASGVPVIELRASIIIGSGSLSFEMIRALVERLPAMITPRWVNVAAQPIFVGDVLMYLREALNAPHAGNEVFEIGGPDVVSYGELMREYAQIRGLRRWMISVPVLTPRLSSLWLGLVTPLYARVGRKLIDSTRHPTVVHDRSALTAFMVQPIGVRESIARALRNEDAECAQTTWWDAVSAARPGEPQWGGVRFGNRLVDSRQITVAAKPEETFAVAERIGGANGWYFADWLWTIRGWMDLIAGGVGMRRGRRDPKRLHAGDVVDCWRVEEIEPGRRLLLAAEMKLPGRAWLEFSVAPERDGARITQTAIFDPVGLFGLAYWYGIWILHQLVFAGMLHGVSRAALRSSASHITSQPPNPPFENT